jgi:peptide/nickel transport system permease protein
MELSIEALAVALLLAVPIGIQAALRPGSRLDVALSALSVTTLSLPNFRLLLILIFAIRLRWLPSAGYVPFADDPQQHIRSMILPVLTLAAAYTGSFSRFSRSLMVEVLEQD